MDDHHGQLVVDSRLIAEQLDIEHKSFLQTVTKHLDTIQQAFGSVAFEMREFKTKQGNTSTERWAWLNEDQATLVMTFSRNTPKVIECKVALVKGFSEAKEKLANTRVQNQVVPPTPKPKPQNILPPSLMEADLSSEDQTYQYLKELGKREIQRKFYHG